MSENEQFFFSESVRHARSLSLGECLQFLRGLDSVIEEAHPAKPRVQSILAQLADTDAQLELIAVGQLQFGDLLKPEAAR